MIPVSSKRELEPDSFSPTVLFVCTGNICRSPLAERLADALWSDRGLRFHSAGVRALTGRSMTVEAENESHRLGGVSRAHSARLLTREMLEDSALVIALARDHRSEIVRMHPPASRYTFTLRELGRLARSADETDRFAGMNELFSAPTLRKAVQILAGERGYSPRPLVEEDDDVVDPYKRSQEIYKLASDQIRDSLTAILAVERSLIPTA